MSHSPARSSLSARLAIWCVAFAGVGAVLAWIVYRLPTAPPTLAPDLAQVALERMRLADGRQYQTSNLVDALASRDSSTCEAAAQVLLDRVERWSQLAPAEAAASMNELAEQLASHFDDFLPPAQQAAQELARQLLSWHLTARTANCAQLLAACDYILRSTAQRGARSTSASRGPGIEGVSSGALDHRRTVEPMPPAASGDRFSLAAVSIPGGGLPIEIGQLARPNDELGDRSSTEQPAGLNAASSNGLVRLPQANEPASLEPEAPARPLVPLRQPDAGARRMRFDTPLVADDNTQTVRWMHDLHADDASLAARAEKHLREQGFTELHLDLARQLTCGDPAVRRQLADRLPAAVGIDAEVWLVWLSRDADPQVRLAALTVMATTGDPRMLKRVAQIAREDADPRVQEQGQRMSASGERH